MMPNLPRHIDPASIAVGDKVQIQLPKNQGIVHTVEGIIHNIDVSGNVTYYYTEEGGNIFAYYPSITGIRVLLISQKNKPGATIFSEKFWTENNEDVFKETRDRIA